MKHSEQMKRRPVIGCIPPLTGTLTSRKHANIILTPPPHRLNPTFKLVKRGFTGVKIIFLFLLKTVGYWYSLEPPRRGGSNKSPQSMF